MDIRRPRRGSRSFRPRKRASTQVCRVNWLPYEENRILGFAGYKVGMATVSLIDNSESPTKGQEIFTAATIIEVPPLVVYGIRGYKNKKVVGDELFLNVDKKALNIRKDINSKPLNPNELDDVTLLVYAQPHKTGIGKKHIERFEIGIGGKNSIEKYNLAKKWLGKELKFSDVFKEGEFVDVVAVTKGKGWQGAVKRFGVSKQRRKATGKIRHVGTLGAWHPNYVLYTVPQAGQTGYHKRTELNKAILKISNNPTELKFFDHYGVVRNDYIILKGSVPGPAKRLIKFRLSHRAKKPLKDIKVIFNSALKV